MARDPIDKQALQEMAATVDGTYFDDFRPSIHKYLRLSRNKKFMSNPVNHLALQLAILQALEEGDDAIRQGRELAKDRKDPQHIQNLRNQHLNTAYKVIADGIAWRTLEFNRFHIRILSQARSPGATDNKIGRKAEREMAKRVAEVGGDHVLFNDATNILRVGDLVFIKPDNKPHHLYLAEMKMRRKKMVLNTIKSIKEKIDKGRGVSTQEKRLWQAQLAIAKNEFAIAGKPAAKVLETQPGKLKHYMRKVNNHLVRANKEGASEGFVSKYMYVSAVDMTYYKKGGTLDAGPSRAPKDLQPILFLE